MIDRRSLLIGLAAAVALPRAGFANGPRARRFDILRGDKGIGSQSLSVRRAGDETFADTTIEIAVKVLGITVYRYGLESREVWRGGRLVKLDATCNDDGKDEYVRAQATDKGLLVDGSGHQGVIPADAAPTSYWSPTFLTRTTWISTQTGAPLSVRCTDAGEETIATGAGPATARRWNVRGDLDISLFYAGDEWAGTSFAAKGAEARIAPVALNQSISELLSKG
jgi:hypothetical protein